MLASSHTISRIDSTTHNPSSTSLLLRGTRQSDLTAARSSSSSSHRASRTPLFTWPDLLTIVSTGQLHKLSRHPEDLRAYFAWMSSIKSSYGSVTNFLLSERFTATRLLQKPSPPPGEACFRSHFIPNLDCQILINDWPYSIPPEVTHYVVWSHLPILHPDLVASATKNVADVAWSVIAKRGLCGTLTPSPTFPQEVSEGLTQTAEGLGGGEREELQRVLVKACDDVVGFIGRHWDVQRSEVAFFANPPSLQSVPSLAHFHVLVKPRS